MTRESLPAGYAIAYLPSRAILWTPACRAIKIDIDTAYKIMMMTLDSRESAIVAECQRIDRSVE